MSDSQVVLDSKLTDSSIAKNLSAMASKLKAQSISALVEAPNRIAQFTHQVAGIHFDFSKNLITDEVMSHLIALAQAKGIYTHLQAMLSGEAINRTENRAVRHCALRGTIDDNAHDKAQIEQDIAKVHEQMAKMVEQIHHQQWLGCTGKPIQQIVNIGIGGSDLGPLFAVEALEPYHQNKCDVHFVSNLDPYHLESTLKDLNPEETMFIVASKSFTTQETLSNFLAGKKWLKEKLGEQDFSQHFVAVTANGAKAKEHDLTDAQILPFWDWVGGRYSIWSAIGLPVALSIGMTNFKAMLSGANELDHHFINAPIQQNAVMQFALIGFWYHHFMNAPSYCVVPYDVRLRNFSNYLQQMDMESNGKQINAQGQPVAHATGPIVWGNMGTNAQHAFFQLLHQGQHFIPVDIIAVAKGHAKDKTQHQHTLSHALAQAKALMEGQEGQTAFDKMPGNRPSNMLMLEQLTPQTLGALIALYEHKVFVQGVLWGLNSFDQPGVELGKKLAKVVASKLVDGQDAAFDASTEYLLNIIDASTK